MVRLCNNYFMLRQENEVISSGTTTKILSNSASITEDSMSVINPFLFIVLSNFLRNRHQQNVSIGK